MSTPYRIRNFQICDVIDLTGLGCVIHQLIEDGADPKDLEPIDKIAEQLRIMLRRINDQTNDPNQVICISKHTKCPKCKEGILSCDGTICSKIHCHYRGPK